MNGKIIYNYLVHRTSIRVNNIYMSTVLFIYIYFFFPIINSYNSKMYRQRENNNVVGIIYLFKGYQNQENQQILLNSGTIFNRNVNNQKRFFLRIHNFRFPTLYIIDKIQVFIKDF